MTATPSTTLRTDRLVLRLPALEDAVPLQALCCNWEVVRMTSRVPHPYTLDHARSWIAGRAASWAAGRAYAFALTCDGIVIGVAGIESKDGEHEIGYWIGQPWWGRGLATEAVGRLCRFGFDDLGLERLVAGHFDDNPASGRVLAKCGFAYTGSAMLYSMARGGQARSARMELTRDRARADGRTGS